jgi:HTH-type transcriptional regulator/antitoxin HigA
MKPIKSEKDCKDALERIEALMDAELDTPEGDELDVLTTLVVAYETKHYPIDPPDPIEAILFRMDQMGLKRSALEPFVGGRSRVSEILGRKRHLSTAMIRKLNSGLGISADILIRDYPLHKKRA